MQVETPLHVKKCGVGGCKARMEEGQAMCGRCGSFAGAGEIYYIGQVFVSDWSDHANTVGIMNFAKGGSTLYKMPAGELVDGKTAVQIKAKAMARVFKPYKIQVSVQYKADQDCVGLTVWDWHEIKGDVAAACPALIALANAN